MSLVARKVNYVRGHEDDTVSGSRSCISQILAWYLYQSEGIAGQRQYVQTCLDGRDKLVTLVKSQLPWVNVLPCSPWVNFAPMEIDIEDGQIPEEIRERNGILAPYHLRSDFFSDGHFALVPGPFIRCVSCRTACHTLSNSSLISGGRKTDGPRSIDQQPKFAKFNLALSEGIRNAEW